MGEQKQTALITGASSGIGRETAIKLAANDFQVIAAARRMDRLNELAGQFQAITPKQVDLSQPENLEKFCSYLSGLPNPVSVLINNAGYSIIVNLSSIVGKFSFPGGGIYAASKYAVEGITDALRVELAPLGIKVVAIRPGAIATEFNEVATEFNEVATELTGDLMARTDPDYKPIYQTAGAETGKLFADLTIPGPDLIADLILEAVLSDVPKAVYSAGPLSEEFLGKRASLDDDAYHRFMLEKFGLINLQI
jgi:short-subunit dehydrogenase